MAYSDQKFHSHTQKIVSVPAANFGTSTATASAQVITTVGVGRLPSYIKASRVLAVKVAVDTAGAAGQTGRTINFLNGTATFASVAMDGLTAGQYGTAVMTLTNGTVGTGVQPTMNFVGTATASNSGIANGSYTVYFDEAEQPS